MKSSANKGGGVVSHMSAFKAGAICLAISSSHDTLQRPREACTDAWKMKLWRPTAGRGKGLWAIGQWPRKCSGLVVQKTCLEKRSVDQIEAIRWEVQKN